MSFQMAESQECEQPSLESESFTNKRRKSVRRVSLGKQVGLMAMYSPHLQDRSVVP